MARRGDLRPCTGPDLLAATATVALVAGVVLAFAAGDLYVVADIPLWDAALVLALLLVLASVLSFPDWWRWAGGWGNNGRACEGARVRRASHSVDLRRARAPRARRQPDVPGAHRPARLISDGPLASATHRSQAEWLLAQRRRDGMARLQHQHGRSRR